MIRTSRTLTLKSLSLCALLAASCAAAPVELWTAYTGWPTCYRQPFLVKTSRALLAFVESRMADAASLACCKERA